MEERKKSLLDKFSKSEDRINKQKDLNNRTMTSKFLQQTIRQEDSNENVSRYEKQMEYAKQKKLEQIKERERRLAEMQRQKLEIAEEKKLDLVLVAPNSKPPVCKIMNYGKYKFEQAKKEKEATGVLIESIVHMLQK